MFHCKRVEIGVQALLLLSSCFIRHCWVAKDARFDEFINVFRIREAEVCIFSNQSPNTTKNNKRIFQVGYIQNHACTRT